MARRLTATRSFAMLFRGAPWPLQAKMRRRRRIFACNGHGAPRNSIAKERVAVSLRAMQRKKQRTRLHFPRIASHLANFQSCSGRGHAGLNALKQGAQRTNVIGHANRHERASSILALLRSRVTLFFFRVCQSDAHPSVWTCDATSPVSPLWPAAEFQIAR